uniref:Uncharacterized protein n=1 Tax=Panagrolaimus davidi TaxID=227884 RepID=A0A914QUA1_9BILA
MISTNNNGGIVKEENYFSDCVDHYRNFKLNENTRDIAFTLDNSSSTSTLSTSKSPDNSFACNSKNQYSPWKKDWRKSQTTDYGSVADKLNDKQWKKDNHSPTTTKSTLSLYIAAYEDSVEATGFESFDSKNLLSKWNIMNKQLFPRIFVQVKK